MGNTLKSWTDRYNEIREAVFAAVYDRMGQYQWMSMAAINHLTTLTEMNITLENIAESEDHYWTLCSNVSAEWSRVLQEAKVDPVADAESESDCYIGAMACLSERCATPWTSYGDAFEFLAAWHKTPRI